MTGPVMILAGGTGGHIFPGLAVARALRDRQVPVLWLGAANGMETRLVPLDGFEIRTLDVRGLRGKGFASTLGAPLVLLRSLWQAIRAVRRARPRALVSFGGFAAGPGGLAAWLLRRPLIVHEQNRAPSTPRFPRSSPRCRARASRASRSATSVARRCCPRPARPTRSPA